MCLSVNDEFVSNICEALDTSLITEKEIRGGWAREMLSGKCLPHKLENLRLILSIQQHTPVQFQH